MNVNLARIGGRRVAGLFCTEHTSPSILEYLGRESLSPKKSQKLPPRKKMVGNHHHPSINNCKSSKMSACIFGLYGVDEIIQENQENERQELLKTDEELKGVLDAASAWLKSILPDVRHAILTNTSAGVRRSSFSHKIDARQVYTLEIAVYMDRVQGYVHYASSHSLFGKIETSDEWPEDCPEITYGGPGGVAGFDTQHCYDDDEIRDKWGGDAAAYGLYQAMRLLCCFLEVSPPTRLTWAAMIVE